jgi:hypothetical protein
MRRARRLSIAAFFSLGTLAGALGAASQGCGSDSGGGSPSDEAGADAPQPGEAGTDGAADSGEVTDGGSNIEPDASASDDAGPDGGPCNAVSNDAPAIASICISVLPLFEGGPIEPGTYYLTAVAAIASKAFCQSSFIPTGFRETMVVTVDPAGVATAELAVQIAGSGVLHRTASFAPGSGGTSPATGTSTCPPDVPGKVPYTSAVRNTGRHVLSLLLPYGKGAAVYRFEKQ